MCIALTFLFVNLLPLFFFLQDELICHCQVLFFSALLDEFLLKTHILLSNLSIKVSLVELFNVNCANNCVFGLIALIIHCFGELKLWRAFWCLICLGIVMQPMILFRFVAWWHFIPIATFKEKLALYLQSLLIHVLITNFIIFKSVVTAKEFAFGAFKIIFVVAKSSGCRTVSL